MIVTLSKKILPSLLSLLLVATTTPGAGAQDQQPPPANSSDYTGQGAPLSAQELNSLVAPIALYPDALVAQILSASTYPDQVAAAEYWIGQNKNLTGSALMQAVNTQSWDPSVKALTQFPSVLSDMAQNISWTSQLGDAYHNQSQQVMAAIQTLRKQAQAAGNLKSTPQQTVTTQTQGSTQVIVIQPANPQVVYVPQYNPTVVYGTPYTTPGYSTGALVATGLLSFGAGIAVGAMMSGGCCGWGYSSWNCNWYHGGAYYGGHPYYGNAAWHGGYYNGGYHDGYGYHNAYNRADASSFRGGANRIDNFNREEARSLNASHADSWAHHDGAFGKSNAFSGFGDRFGGGWASRANSFRGWGSLRAGGFGGGRFGGGRFGGGHFGGFHGGFRR